MTVKELIEQLKKEDPDRLVILQKDSEGNGYSPFYDLYTGSYEAESTWGGHVGLEELTEEDIKHGYGEGDVVNGEKALILTPIN